MRLAVALAVLLSTTHASAEAFVAAKPSAAQLFVEGRELKAAGKIDEACKRFEISWKAERAPGTEVNLADCREREGKLLEAWQLFDEAARVSEQQGNQARAQFARNRASAIDARLMTIEVHVAAPIARGMVLTIDGQPIVVNATVRQRIEAKQVWIRATAPDGKSYTIQVEARAGKTVVDVPSLVRSTTVRRRSRLWISGGLLVGSVAGLVAGQRLMMIADDLRDNIPGCTFNDDGEGSCVNYAALEAGQNKIELAKTNETAARIIFGGSVLAVLGAAYVYYTAPKERVLLTPTATTSSVGVSLAGRF
ncbi:MAG TPA: hypothetical protein VIV11_20280 [Kofleriaceae bacterium]